MQIPWEAIVGIIIYVIGSTVGFVWWMATQTITLQFVREDLAAVHTMLSKIESIYATKIELTEKLTPIIGSLNKAWDKIDVLMVRNGNKE